MIPCNSCTSMAINGVFVHELGCPDAWQTMLIACRECGCNFQPEIRYVDVCPDCEEAWNTLADADDELGLPYS